MHSTPELLLWTGAMLLRWKQLAMAVAWIKHAEDLSLPPCGLQGEMAEVMGALGEVEDATIAAHSRMEQQLLQQLEVQDAIR